MTAIEQLRLYDEAMSSQRRARDSLNAALSGRPSETLRLMGVVLVAMEQTRGLLVGMLTAEEGVAYYQGLIESQKAAAEELVRLTT